MPDDLADTFFINKYNLARSFKNQCGSLIFNYVMGQRIAQAEKMLHYTDKQLKSFGRDYGFEGDNYFTRMFKKMKKQSHASAEN